MRVSLGSVTSTLFVAHEHVADRAVHQGVVRRKDTATWVAEDQVDVLVLERSDQGLRASDPFRCCW